MDFQPKKIFTPAEARQTLPLVRRIVNDILNLSYEINSLSALLGDDASGHPQIEEMLTHLDDYFREMEEIGCYYKDWGFSIGLVDFPAIIDGELVFLCWRSDEPEIRFYHSIDAGYAGRKEIP
ncbi:MAG: DUF2203 domain-containing protein [Calditrichaeota bacterium]|nr:DUF2203 domain-containing protein [Calditrichota bacterium]MCB0289257.1 DUF2203 domain-containing protein [Calditrichota bacterium]MCB0296340.1 DUF2203 domain-containing protein [Calditrichota bacterium]MCB0302151.1 DUF2203 domain-containing protein [Calditrichota bacterium]MCB9090525.1 DUF2203 domain-containing protein [Calditrichia bacterium]